jgi:hypothetical protein
VRSTQQITQLQRLTWQEQESLSHAMNKKHTLIALATAWGPKYGGLNAFNYDLLIAVAAAHWSWLRVVCIVAECTETEVQSAQDQYQVELINLGLTGGSIGKEHAALAWSKLQAAGFSKVPDNTVWLGHDRITGAVTIELAKSHGGDSALIHHMSYAHYESFVEDSATSNVKENEQKQLFTDASICMAIGPLLRGSAADMLDREREDIPMLIPGLAEISPRKNHNIFIAFVSGRLDASSKKLKQVHLGVAGFAHAVQCCDSNPNLPDALRGEHEPRLRLRGIDLEKTPSADSTDAETELKALALQHAKRVIRLSALPFTQDRTELFDELKAASVCIMPSWHEGFGLVAWEAIAAGVPLVLSKKSGAYQFLKALRKEHLIHAIDVKGQDTEPFFADEDKVELANLLIKIAKDHPAMRAAAHQLREELQNDYNWRACADSFVTALNWQAPTTPVVTPPPPSISIATTRTNTSDLAQWVELPAPLWHQHSGLSPSQLLKAEEALIPFAAERTIFLQTQLDWATTQTHPTCVRLLTGEGGTGKTRLALEMCKRLMDAGWAAGFLKSDVQPLSAPSFVKVLSQSLQPVLLVLDYAETRTDVLLAILAALVSQKSLSPIRVLLIARSSGEWWGQLPSYDSRCEALLDGSATTGPYTLPALYTQPSERNNAFSQALSAFAQALNVAPPHVQPDLSAEQYHSPLYLQMAALLTLLGEHTTNAELLPQSLVRHEQRYWRKVTVNHSQQGMGAGSEAEANLLMSLVTLIGYAPTAKAIEPLWNAAGVHPASLKPLFSSLSPLYPSHQGLGALQPDLLGEALVGRQVLGSSGDALLEAALGEKANSAQRSHALTVLARLLRYRTDLSSPLEVVLSKHFSRCAQALFQVCIQTPGPMSLVAEQSFKNLKPGVALQVAGLLEGNFKHEVLPLAGLELLIRETLHTQALHRCQKPKHSIADRNALGGTLNKLSIAHQQLGNDEKAILFAKQSLNIREQLAKENPESFEPDWATSLGNYANRLADIGDFTQALDCTERALNILEQLAKKQPERFEPGWATSLSNYASHLADIGEITQALDYAKQALDIRERLAEKQPERFEPDWATSLSNYANHLVDIGEITQALDYAKQALDIHERLAEKQPERFEPDWATSLSNYASHLSDVRKTTQVLACAKQALDIRERLAKEKPERFEPDWATSLGNYANRLADVGETTQALACAKQALDIRERLAKEQPERFEPDWAMSLNNYSIHWANVGDTTQALACAEQALSIFERLAKDRPVKFLADVQEGQLTVALWKWLAENTTLLVPTDNIDGSEVPYPMRPARFYRHVVQVLGTEQASEMATAFEALWDSWNEMSKVQQTRWEDTYLLTCAYAQANAYLPQHLGGWRSQINTLNTRRNGHLPQWMRLVAERKGFALGIDE